MFDFSGKVVLITGAAQGFGRVCTVAFAEQRARLAICDINDQGGEETLRQVHEQGADGLYIHADVSKESDVTRLIERTVAAYGRLDIAVNNAAKEIAGPTLDLPSSSFEELVDTNLKGTYYCMKHEVAQMRKNGGGGLMSPTTSSSAGWRATTSPRTRPPRGSRSVDSAGQRRSPRRSCTWLRMKPASSSARSSSSMGALPRGRAGSARAAQRRGRRAAPLAGTRSAAGPPRSLSVGSGPARAG